MSVVLECSWGKCHEFVEIWFTFRKQTTKNGGKVYPKNLLKYGSLSRLLRLISKRSGRPGAGTFAMS